MLCLCRTLHLSKREKSLEDQSPQEKHTEVTDEILKQYFYGVNKLIERKHKNFYLEVKLLQ